MKRIYLWPIFGGAMGTLLSAIGFPLTTWQYWAVSLLALIWVFVDCEFGKE